MNTFGCQEMELSGRTLLLVQVLIFLRHNAIAKKENVELSVITMSYLNGEMVKIGYNLLESLISMFII